MSFNSYTIPRFYIPEDPTVNWPKDQIAIKEYFKKYEKGINKTDFRNATSELCGLPSFCYNQLFNKILMSTKHKQPETIDDNTIITVDDMLKYWQKEMLPYKPEERYFRLVFYLYIYIFYYYYYCNVVMFIK